MIPSLLEIAIRKLTLVFASLALIMATAATSQAGIPDPARSGCGFPALLPCPGPVSVDITLRDAFDVPVANCSTGVSIVLESGVLSGGQETFVSGLTDGSGVVTLTFGDGIGGAGTIRLAVTSYCVGAIAMCESGVYALDCTPPTPVTDATWGRVKSLYR